jgi:hypothetical protein
MPSAATQSIRDAVRAVWAPVYAMLESTPVSDRTPEQWQAIGDARRHARADTDSILRRNVTITASDLNPPRVKCVGQLTHAELVSELGGKAGGKAKAKAPAFKLTKADLEPPTVRCLATLSDKQRVQELGRLAKSWTMGHMPLVASDRMPDIDTAEGAAAEEASNAA